ncbi:flavin reductase family protein [Corynebacterium epidermidicanis]|uniref:Conserved protein of DIM6/NTAB family n=1 Tax=Corynebacterium epidermidicanis TaxID=1050174 RepID=A0A0G3GP00_9CORY|nr:flavin reductase family protein [Corynebacterium epidermidicanis]AKK02956.1 conserved protein of DIM6/NTAB family [Corynebacterium epidermidicanis]
MFTTDFRQTVGTFPSGVTVVTTHDPGSTTLQHLQVGSFIGVSVLSDGQLELAQRFARRGVDKFADTFVHRVADGVPILDGASALFVGKVQAHHLGGDHTILTVLVEKMGHEEAARTLLYQRGSLREWPI